MTDPAWIAFADAAGPLWVAAVQAVDSRHAATDLPFEALPPKRQCTVILRSGKRLLDVTATESASGTVALTVAEAVEGEQWLGARLEVTAAG